MKKMLVLLSLTVLVVAGCQYRSDPARPMIGITSVYRLDKQDNSRASASVDFTYVRAVAENHGVPVVLPSITDEAILQRYVKQLDGLVLVGGADIPPSAYGQQPHQTVKLMPEQRYESETRLISLWLASGKPVLGVCLGMQLVNVVSGGTLIQDIPSQIGTKVGHRGLHRVRIEPTSSLAKILGTKEAFVPSYHHQAVKNVAEGLQVAARSDDGVIEAAERTDGGFGLFVQWHPEQSSDKHHRDAIYGALIRACAAQN